MRFIPEDIFEVSCELSSSTDLDLCCNWDKDAIFKISSLDGELARDLLGDIVGDSGSGGRGLGMNSPSPD